jgi:ribonuclease HI
VPGADSVVVYVDGGARGNPGPAAVGVVITDGDGNELARANDYIGEATNNVAEYEARGPGWTRLDDRQAHSVGDVHFWRDRRCLAPF